MPAYLPPVAIASSILAGFCVLPIFAMLGRVCSGQTVAARLVSAFVLCMVLWVALAMAGTIGEPFDDALAADWLAGAAIMLSAGVATFLVVSLLAWGFTGTMLLDLDRIGTASTNGHWQKEFGNGAGFDRFSANRFDLLIALRVVQSSSNSMRLSPLGSLVGMALTGFSWYFGVVRSSPDDAGDSGVDGTA